MSMAFITVKAAIEGILNAGSVAGGYRVAGHQTDKQSGDQVKDGNRVVRVFYSSGSFPKSASSRSVSKIHDAKYEIQLMVTKACQADLSVLDDPVATDSQRAGALDAAIDSAQIVDEEMDEFIEIVDSVLMTASARYLGLGKGAVADTWIDSVDKGEVTPRGELMGLTASMPLSCRVAEAIGGDTGQSADPILKAVLADVEIWINENTADSGKAAVRGGN